MDWVSLLLSLGIFGVLLAFVINRLWNKYDVIKARKKFLQSIKMELDECYSLLEGEGNLLPIDMWKSGIFTGSLRLIPYEIRSSLARVFFKIECHNYEAEKIRYVSILAATTKEKPKAKIINQHGEKLVEIETPWTHAELLHNELSVRLRKEEEKLKEEISKLLKQDFWDC